jgi:hypothetical protein
VIAGFAASPLCALAAESNAAKAGSFTQGWQRVTLKYDIQKAWDVDVSQRHSYDPATDTHRLWILRGDKPHAPPPNRTGPRAELRFWDEYYAGEHMFEADVYIVRPTTDACIAQIWGSGLSATTMMLHIRTNGDFVAGGGFVLKTNAHDAWFNLKMVHDTAGPGDVRIYIDDELRAQRPGRGYRKDGGGFYFKCGVYGLKGERAEAWFRNIRIWAKPAATEANKQPTTSPARRAETGKD